MGQTKDFLMKVQEEHEAAEAVATEIAMRAGILESCGIHRTVLNKSGHVDFTPAYKLANQYISDQDELVADTWTAETRSDLTDAIKSVCEEAPESCYACEKMMRE
jgi:hypothetical protein